LLSLLPKALRLYQQLKEWEMKGTILAEFSDLEISIDFEEMRTTMMWYISLLLVINFFLAHSRRQKQTRTK
jgi:hypothetical protein